MRRLALAVLLLACQGAEPLRSANPHRGAASARHAAVEIAEPATFIGVLIAAESADIAPRVAGLIRTVDVAVGDKVAEGQVVAYMDPVQLEEERRAAEAAQAAASAAHKQAVVDVEDAKRKLALETKAVSVGVSPTMLLDEARLGVKRARAAAERARSAAAADAARAQTARDHVANLALRAPFAGTVASRFRDAGNRVAAGAPIVRIVGDGRMRLRFAVPPPLAKTLAADTRMTAVVDTVTEPIAALVKHVSPTIDPASGMIVVEAELEGANDQQLQPGLAARVSASGD